MKKALLPFLALALCLSMMTGCGKSADAKAVEEAISALDTENADLTVIEDVVAAYDMLSDKDKNAVENTDQLNSIYYKALYNEIYRLLGTIGEDNNYCALTTCSIWNVSGAQNFYTYYEPIRLINEESDFEKWDNPTVMKWLLASVFCADEIGADQMSVSDSGVSLIAAICNTFNLKETAINENLSSVDNLLDLIFDRFNDDYQSEIENLRAWYSEVSLYSNFSLNPSGNFASYSNDYESYKDDMEEFSIQLDLYNAPDIVSTGE